MRLRELKSYQEIGSAKDRVIRYRSQTRYHQQNATKKTCLKIQSTLNILNGSLFIVIVTLMLLAPPIMYKGLFFTLLFIYAVSFMLYFFLNHKVQKIEDTQREELFILSSQETLDQEIHRLQMLSTRDPK